MTRRGRLRVRNGRDTIPTANDLVYLSQSPDYCQANATIGTLGKQQSIDILPISYSHTKHYNYCFHNIKRGLSFL